MEPSPAQGCRAIHAGVAEQDLDAVAQGNPGVSLAVIQGALHIPWQPVAF